MGYLSTLRSCTAASLVVLAACSGESPTDPVSSVESSAHLAAPVAAKPADGVVHSIGINVHMAYFQTVYGTGFHSIVKPRLVALGVRHLRDYGTVVNDNGWMNTVYGRMKELSNSGMRFALVMKPGPNGSYTNLDHWTRLMSYAAPVVENFQGLNEHDLSGRATWPAEVRSFQQALWNKVRNDPRTAHVPVFGPSLGRPGNAPLVGDLSGVLNYSSINSYPGGDQPLATLDYHRTKLQPLSRSRGFVATETGYHTATSWTGAHPPVSEQAQARYVPRLILEYFQAGLPRTYLYELIDQGTSLTNREMRFGLLRADGSEKPAYRALANMIAILKDQGAAFSPGSLPFTLTGSTSGLKSMLLQKRDGRFYLALWASSSGFNLATGADIPLVTRTVTLKFDTPMRKVQQYRPNMSVAPSNAVANATTVNLSVDDRVLLVEITK